MKQIEYVVRISLEDATKRAPGSTRSPRVLSRSIKLGRDRRALLWASFDARATRQESAYQSAAMVLFAHEREGVRAAFGQAATLAGRGLTDDPYIMAAIRKIVADYAPGGDYHRSWLERYVRLIGETVHVSGADIADAAGVSFDLKNPRIQSTIRSRAKLLADFVTKETARQVSVVTGAGVDAGMGVRDIAGLIDESVFGNQAPVRALRIARTETVGASNEGEWVTARETGVLTEKEWLSQGDDVVRDEHAELDGVRVPLDQEYAPNLKFPGDQRAGPEQVINCRCAQLFYD